MLPVSRQHLWALAGVAIALCIFLWTENHASHSFQECRIQERLRQSTGNADKGRFIIARAAEPQIICTARLLDSHNGLVAALAGIAIAWFTFTLKRSTDKLWSVSNAQAKTAERALVDLERPFIYVNVKHPLATLDTGSFGGTTTVRDHGYIDIVYSNFGRTPASLTRIEIAVVSAPQGSMADAIDPKIVGGIELPVGVVSDKGDPHTERRELRNRFVGAEGGEINERKRSIWIVGFVRYKDIFTTNYITGFAVIYDPIRDRFFPKGGEKYNYARMEKVEDLPEPSSRG